MRHWEVSVWKVPQTRYTQWFPPHTAFWVARVTVPVKEIAIRSPQDSGYHILRLWDEEGSDLWKQESLLFAPVCLG